MGPKKLCIAHDWNPVHRSKAVKEFIAGNTEICELDWPPNSGDIMPMERIWDQMLKDPIIDQQGKLISISNENLLFSKYFAKHEINRWNWGY